MKTRLDWRIVVGVVVAVGAVLLVVSRPSAQSSGEPPGSETPQKAADQSLEILRLLATEEHYRMLGFESLEEVARARLGDPLSVYRVPHDRLLKFDPRESDPETLLVDASRLMFPVVVDGKVRTSLSVEGPEGWWVGTDWGGPNLMRALAKYRRAESDFVVHVPFAKLYFVAAKDRGGLVLTPIVDYPEFDFAAGRSLTAVEVIEAIIPAAKEYDGEAPW